MVAGTSEQPHRQSIDVLAPLVEIRMHRLGAELPVELFDVCLQPLRFCGRTVPPFLDDGRLAVPVLEESSDHLAQVTKHGCRLGGRRGGDSFALAPSLVAWKVVLRTRHLRLPVPRAQELDRGKAVEGMLKATAAVERPLEIVAPEAAGLVVEHLEL